MSNLLEKASILLTPTAYDDGKILSVKPEDGTGDFDFTRNSSATRVNSEGLIEDVQILSSNLVSNGDFSQEGSEQITNGDFATDSDWTKQTSWSISGGSANYDASLGTSNIISSTLNITNGKSYKLKFNVISGNARLAFTTEGSQGLFKPNGNGANNFSVGEYYFYLVAENSASALKIFAYNVAGGQDCSITNVSVKEVGQDWTLGAGWSIGADEATHTGSGGYIEQGSLTQGSNYRVVINVTQASGSGFPQIYMGGLTTAMTSVGTYTFNIVAVANDKIKIRGLNDCKISSVSVIEITEDTNLPRINYEGFSYQDSLGSEEIVNGTFDENVNGWVTNNANASFVWQINKTALFTSTSFAYVRASPALNLNAAVYKVSFDILSFEGTLSNVHIGLGTAGNVITTTGSYTYFYTSTGGSTEFQIRPNSGGTGSITIDNVSVKEYLGQEVVPDSGCGSWLFEPQSTNTVTYSEDFSQWNKSNVSLINTITSTVVSPNGVSYANKLYPIGAGSNAYIKQTIAGDCFSIFVKKGERKWILIYGGFANSNVWFDSENGVLGTIKSEATATVESFGNDWYRIKILWTQNCTQVRIYNVDSDNSLVSTGNGTDGLYIWGAQLEQNSFATSYIPTEGAIKTRLQDAAFGAGSSDLINSTEGVLYAEIAALANENVQRISSISDGTANNTIQLGFLNSATNYKFFASVRVGGAFQAFMVYDFGAVQPTFKKVAVKYKQNDFALWIDGVKVVTDTSGNVPTGLNKLSFDRGDGGQDFFGKTKCVAVFKEALTDDELECLTSDETSFSSFTALALANNYTII